MFCGDGPLNLCYKLKIWYVSTHRYLVLENIPFGTKAPLILLMSTFFLQKISNFCTFYRPCVRNSASGLLRISHKLEKRQWLYNLPTWPNRPIPANISTLFQRCLLVDATSRRGTMSNQRWNNVVYFNVERYNVKQRRINVVYLNVDMNNVRQRRNNVVIFNVEFYNVGKRWNNVV